MWIHEQPDWPRLHWNEQALPGVLADVRHRQGRLMGCMEALGFDLRREAVLGTPVEDVVKSSDIEGKKLDAGQVRSLVAQRLGVDAGGMGRADRDVEGIVEMTLDATREYDQPLAADRLHDWHASLFPTGRSGMRRITVGAWRKSDSDPMQVVSGPAGRSDLLHLPRRQVAGLAVQLHADEVDRLAEVAVLVGVAPLLQLRHRPARGCLVGRERVRS